MYENSCNLQEKFNAYLSPPPVGLEQEYRVIFSPKAVEFLVDLYLRFQSRVNELYAARLERKYAGRRIPKFSKNNITDSDWKVAPVSERLRNRHLDLGDVSPSDYMRFTGALKARVQGIQVDFDDGHCPTWQNQIIGLHNVYRAVRNEIPNVPRLADAPVLLFRPRAWNMLEHNVSVSGRSVPGPLVDFALLTFHNAKLLMASYSSGPFFYLSKLESAREARLWNDIFTWSQLKLRLPYGTIKACVLVENVLAAFELDDILYELRDHSLGLNCGMWDYAASIIAKFGEDSAFVLPDRNKYVSMDRHFMKKYMVLVVSTCRRRSAPVTGGMSAKLLPPRKSKDFDDVLQSVIRSKLTEIQAGVDGFIIYDLNLVEHMNDVWSEYGGAALRRSIDLEKFEEVTEADLLKLPVGGVTEEGLKHNIAVGILFIFHWLCGKGVFAFKGAIEDSATAEISRAQVWQWIRYSVAIEDRSTETSPKAVVTRKLVFEEATGIFESFMKLYGINNSAKVKLGVAFNLFLQIVNQREFPDFITTYLNDAYVFRQVSANL